MKQIKLLSPLLIGSTLLLFTACGGGSSNGGDAPKTAKSVSEAKENFKALGAFSAMTSSVQSSTSQSSTSTKQQKTQSQNCTKGGSVSYTETSNVITLAFSSCKEGNTFMDGTMSLTQSDDEVNTKVQFKNLTIDDGETKTSSRNFVFEENSQEYWSTLDGDLDITSKCFTGKFAFETIAKIYDVQDDSENAESGILKMNGATYTFNNPYVTIKAGDEERTILQSELEKEMTSSESCSI